MPLQRRSAASLGLAAVALACWLAASAHSAGFAGAPARGAGRPRAAADAATGLLRGARLDAPAGAAGPGEPPLAAAARLAAAGAAALGLLAGALAGAASPARADAALVGEIQASGLIFKDTINVQAITDPKVSGVTIYQSDFAKSGFDKLKSGDFFSDPGASGLSCIGTPGKVMVAANISKDKGGEVVYEESKALLGKTLKVKRVYDEKNKNVVYVVYTERLNKDEDKNNSRFKSQVCAIHVDGVQ